MAELLEAGAACLPVAIFAPPRAAVFAVTGFIAFFARAPLPEFVFGVAMAFLVSVFFALVFPEALAALFAGRFNASVAAAFFASFATELALRAEPLRVAKTPLALPRTFLLRPSFDEFAGFLAILADFARRSVEAFELLAAFLFDGIRVTLPYRPALETGQTSHDSPTMPLHGIGLAAPREHRNDETQTC
ncbi:MAG: hypothetical protein WBQ53_02970 [Methylocystis sp.]